jgi:FKBP-type peptidyl-prolyl cis-trans isomerase
LLQAAAMKRVFPVSLATLLLGLLGCGRSEPAAPAAPEVDETAVWREKYFGPDAVAAKDIAWRSTGLGVRIIAPGQGSAPSMTDRVMVHYVGRLKDGRVFEDSHLRGKPPVFVVNQLVTGWAAAMPLLKPGGRAIFYIPPHLGYGGLRSGNIPAYSGLIFEVELIAVNPDEPAKP